MRARLLGGRAGKNLAGNRRSRGRPQERTTAEWIDLAWPEALHASRQAAASPLPGRVAGCPAIRRTAGTPARRARRRLFAPWRPVRSRRPGGGCSSPPCSGTRRYSSRSRRWWTSLGKGPTGPGCRPAESRRSAVTARCGRHLGQRLANQAPAGGDMHCLGHPGLPRKSSTHLRVGRRPSQAPEVHDLVASHLPSLLGSSRARSILLIRPLLRSIPRRGP